MERLFRPTKRLRAQRGDSASGHRAIGRSRGGLSTKIVGMVDAFGNLFRFLLLPGQAHDMKGVVPLIRDVPYGALLADNAFDVDRCPATPLMKASDTAR